MSQNKQDIINERQANLPLPDQPPQASDWNSADSRTVNVGSGRNVTADIDSSGRGSDSLRGPATADSSARVDGEEWGVHTAGMDVGRTAKDGLKGLPNDAVSRGSKDKEGLAETTGKDYGYPANNDPSEGIKK